MWMNLPCSGEPTQWTIAGSSTRGPSSSFKSSKEREREREREKEQEPCCSKTLMKQPSSSEKGRGDAQESHPTRGEVHPSIDQQQQQPLEPIPGGSLCVIGDVKKQITKFLEELIERHPETLDAIESVRMNRLLGHATAGAVNTPSTAASTTATSRLAKDGTHVAFDHTDTTQGAVHSFQDEHGNWFTYSFDETGGGSGVAQPLGSSRAVYEMMMVNRRRGMGMEKTVEDKAPPPIPHGGMPTTLVLLSKEKDINEKGKEKDIEECAVVVEEEEEEERALPPTQVRHHHPRGRRPRVPNSSNANYSSTPSSTSDDSDSSQQQRYLSHAPMRVFHPASFTLPTGEEHVSVAAAPVVGHRRHQSDSAG